MLKGMSSIQAGMKKRSYKLTTARIFQGEDGSITQLINTKVGLQGAAAPPRRVLNNFPFSGNLKKIWKVINIEIIFLRNHSSLVISYLN